MVTFLAQPEVQGYIATNSGQSIAQWTGAFGPGTPSIFGTGPAGSQNYLSMFTFSSGALVSSQLISALGISNPIGQSSVCVGGDGKLWWTDAGSGSIMNAYHVDPSTWTVDDQVATTDAQILCDNLVYLTMGSTHWLVVAAFVSANVNSQIMVYRADPPAYPTGGFGFWGHIFNDGDVLGGNSDVCAGPQSSASATAYWTTKPHSIYGSVFALSKTVIVAGADTYNPSTWPTANPDITSTVLKQYIGTDFDAGWNADETGITYLSGPAYDATDGNVLVQVSGTPGGNAHYVAKLSTADGHVIWKLPLTDNNGFDPEAMTLSRIKAGTYFYWDGSAGVCHAIATATGTDTPHTFGPVSLSIGQQVSDDTLGAIYGNVGWSGSGLVLLNSTPSSGGTMGAVYFAQGQGPPGSGAKSYFNLWG